MCFRPESNSEKLKRPYPRGEHNTNNETMATQEMKDLFQVLEANHVVVPLYIKAALEEFDSVQNSKTGSKMSYQNRDSPSPRTPPETSRFLS